MTDHEGKDDLVGRLIDAFSEREVELARERTLTLDAAIAQLTALRERCGGELPVVLARDDDGNGFSPLERVDLGTYEDGPAIVAWPIN